MEKMRKTQGVAKICQIAQDTAVMRWMLKQNFPGTLAEEAKD